MYQFVSANQFSPRLSFTYKPFENTTFHAGYARYFTPPVLVEAAPANIASVQQHHRRVGPARTIRCCRSARIISMPASTKRSNSDAPQTENCSTLDLGVDAYYKIATDLIDNGLFGQALVLSAFNYARGYNEGIEFNAKYNSGNFQAYANVSRGAAESERPSVEPISVRQHHAACRPRRLDPLQYLQTHFIYTDHNQFVTASAGAVYQFCGRIATAAEARLATTDHRGAESS